MAVFSPLLFLQSSLFSFFNCWDFKLKPTSTFYTHIRIYNFFLLPDIEPKETCVQGKHTAADYVSSALLNCST